MLAVVMAASILAACGGSDVPETTAPAVQSQPNETQPAETKPAETQPAATTQPQAEVGEVYDPGTALAWALRFVPAEGDCGLTAVTLPNGVTFRVGMLVSDLEAAGMELDEDDAAVTVAPWAHYTAYFFYTVGENYHSLSVDVLNESSAPSLVSDCRIYHTRLYEDGIVLENGIVIGQTTTEEALALFGTDDMYNLIQGTGVNMLEASVSSSDNVVYAVELTYMEHILNARTDSDGDDSLELSVLENYGLSDFEDYGDVPNLEEVLGVDELQLTVAGSTVTFGPNGNTMQSLADLGWSLRELDEEDKKLESGHYLAMFMTPATVGDYEISGFDVCNYSKDTMDTMSCYLKGIDLENPLYYETENEAAAPFDFYGVTADSTIQDVIALLGTPRSAFAYAPTCSITLSYYFYNGDRSNTTLVEITFDYMTNQIVDLSIY